VDKSKSIDPKEITKAILNDKFNSYYDINNDGEVTVNDISALEENINKVKTPLGSGVDPKVTVSDDNGHVTVNLAGLSRNVYSQKIKDPRNTAIAPYPD